jgi:phosphoglucosamine mutase
MLGVMDRERAFLSDLVSGYKEFPQVLRNVRVSSKPDLASLPEVAAAIAEVEAAIVGRGRLDVRYSGTEPLARVMVEGEDKAQVEAWAARIAIEVEKRLGGGV